MCFIPSQLVRIITKRTLKSFWEIHNDCEQSLLSWYKVAKKLNWTNSNEVKAQFGSCKIVGSDRIVFKIKGNKYQLIVKVTFVNQIMWIRFIGTHNDYDKIDAKTI